MSSYSSVVFTSGTFDLNSYLGYDNIITNVDTTIILPTLPLEGYNVIINNTAATNIVKIIPQTGQTLNGVINNTYYFDGNAVIRPFVSSAGWVLVKGQTGGIGSVGVIGYTGIIGAAGGTGAMGGFFPMYIFGDGSDGGATFDGVNTYSYATLSGSVYTLTRAIYLTTGLVTKTIKTNGFRIFVSDTLTVNGTITYAGNSGVGSVGGAALPTNFIGGGEKGGAGGVDANGTAGGALTPNACGGAGGSGGSGTSSRLGGAGGAVTRPIASFGGIQVVNAMPYYLMGNNKDSTTDSKLKGGAGGGGGGAVNNSTGGGGGGGGGFMIVSARNLGGTGTITVAGGAGANGTLGAGTGAGGGGGGGGGFMTLIYDVKTFSGTLSVAGGAGGTGVGTGGAGISGSNGTKQELNI